MTGDNSFTPGLSQTIAASNKGWGLAWPPSIK
jgi:hypothetical protein